MHVQFFEWVVAYINEHSVAFHLIQTNKIIWHWRTVYLAVFINNSDYYGGFTTYTSN